MTKLILSGFMLSLSFIVNAAIIQPLETIKSPTHFFKIMKNNKKSQKVNHIIEEIFSNKPRTQATEPKKIVNNRFKKLIKNLALEHSETLLFQESLATLYDAKQVWNTINDTANRFSSDISETFDVEQIIHTNLRSKQKLPPLIDPNITALSATFLNSISILGAPDSKNIEFIRRKREIERAEKETLNSPLELVTFNIQMIYYAIGLVVAIFLLQSAIKMILP